MDKFKKIRLENELTMLQSEVDLDLSIIKKGIYFLVILLLIVVYLILSQTFTYISPNTLNGYSELNKTSLSSDNLIIINKFGNNNALGDIGDKINIKANNLSLRDIKNCKTSDMPEIDSGCNFTILTSNLDKQNSNKSIKSIQFKTEKEVDLRLVLAVKDFQKGKLTKLIGVLNPENLTYQFEEPLLLKSYEGIDVRLWSGQKEVKITDILIEY